MSTDEQPDSWQGLWDYVGHEGLGVDGHVSRSRMVVQQHHMAPNGYMQATVGIGLADMCCAGGTFATIPEGANFTTIELKSNLVGTARVGATLLCEATMLHGGRTTQVWDAVVKHEDTGKPVMLFRCTQLVLHPKH